jgi:nickel/cobalt transporter (NiCoT) family protein
LFNLIKQIFNDENRRVRKKVVGLYVFLALANLALWGVAIATFHNYPLLLGASFLAYSLPLSGTPAAAGLQLAAAG